MSDPILWDKAIALIRTDRAVQGNSALVALLEARGRHQHAKGLARYKDDDGKPRPLRASTDIQWLEYACEEAADSYIYLLGAALQCSDAATRRQILDAKVRQLVQWARLEMLAEEARDRPKRRR